LSTLRAPPSAGHLSLPKGKGTTMRVIITLACNECKRRNYVTTKNKKTTPDRLEKNKYCRFCRAHHPHKETK
jgi:large subunit ribosomal protein L33